MTARGALLSQFYIPAEKRFVQANVNHPSSYYSCNCYIQNPSVSADPLTPASGRHCTDGARGLMYDIQFGKHGFMSKGEYKLL